MPGDLLGHQDCGISCEPEITTVDASNKAWTLCEPAE